MQQQALSRPSPPLDGWDVAGWSCQANALGGAFHDWRFLADGRLAVVVADACDGGVAGALVATALRTALHNALEATGDPAEILNRLHITLQRHGAGDAWAGMALAMLSLETGKATIASAGRPTALLLSDSQKSLLKPTLPLGLSDRLAGQTQPFFLEESDTLVLYARGFVEAGDQHGHPLSEQLLAKALWETRDRSASQLIDVLCDRQEAHSLKPNQLDRSVVIVKRLPR
jgi:sigma-B regulation protein RsbU (phosphoserine phosphatase)